MDLLEIEEAPPVVRKKNGPTWDWGSASSYKKKNGRTWDWGGASSCL